MSQFISNKYTTWYNAIVERARTRVLDSSTYCERHHVLPRSIGGLDDQSNLVALSAREHFICHWLLTRMTVGEDKIKMWYAFSAMTKMQSSTQQRYQITGRKYENIKRQRSVIQSEAMTGANNPNYGKRWSEAQRAKMRGHTRNVGKKKASHSDEAKVQMRESAKKRVTQDLLDQLKRATQTQFVCEHCGKTGKGAANYNRWHGNNCRAKQIGE